MQSDVLPTEILSHIVSYLPLDEDVSKVFKSIADDDSSWKNVLYDRFPLSKNIITKNLRWAYYQMSLYLKQNKRKRPLKTGTDDNRVLDKRVLICGAGGVGCSALLIQFVQGVWVTEYDPTIEDSYRKQISVDDQKVILECLDVAGQEEYSSMRQGWFKFADYVILVFGLNSRTTFTEDLPQWYEGVIRTKEKRPAMLLVGNKCDLVEDREVSTEEATKWAKQRGMEYMEATASNTDSSTNVFLRVICIDPDLETKELWQSLADGKEIATVHEEKKKCLLM